MAISASASVGDTTPYRAIRGRILGGELAPGSTLTSSGLAGELGVSRSPVREALSRLELEGLVERTVAGYLVPLRSAEEILEICDARIALDAAATQAAARHASELDLARLEHLLEQSRQAKDTADRLRLDHEFHLALRAAGRNSTISRLLDGLETRLAAHDSTSTSAPDNLELISHEHRRILEAVRDRDAEKARAEMTAHQTRARDLRIATLARRGG
ncbi:GntR family transcriptional regulator [Saccharopolyspora phatthalungensis]|uniref:DNA-binding GntR family transcriptional regulator n=1 Tax=Saccharopolyspora phatthalungensis TaxID=664693 RepID=A0A840QH63_9PSEU|nr:GntR family transcriptional regulator [Saccharopolyspora phatthalungensis]MBB5159487.1 DNA-binding GntR family transcriptional regulator [Saccharopolyspora phatthalungensis]